MKKKWILLGCCSLFSLWLTAQRPYEVLEERPNEKSIKGFIDRAILEQEPGFGWFQENYKAYRPHATGLATLRQFRDSLQLLVIMGTWCEDSHFIVPRFYSLIDSAGIPPTQLSVMGVDRQKKTWGQLTTVLGVTQVPTIIVFRGGKEIGRVVEYGRYGQFDRELGEIVQKSFAQ